MAAVKRVHELTPPPMFRLSDHELNLSELFSPQVFLGAEVERMKDTTDAERGAIYTRSEVVDFILDLAGYTTAKHLHEFRLLEPSFGSGDFLLPALERLFIVAKNAGKTAQELLGTVRAVELHRQAFVETKEKVIALATRFGFTHAEATMLADVWLLNGDFLIEPMDCRFDFIVGNPPYIRQEMIPAPLLAEYRRRYASLYDRADLYVPFIERSLTLLNEDGILGFICSDRWMKNKYGGPLREMIAQGYSLRYYVDMVGTAAFQSEVIAYPAITIIQRGQHGTMRLAHRPEVSTEKLARLRRQITGSPAQFNGTVIEMPRVPRGSAPWLLEADAQPSLALVRRLESSFPTLAEAGCSIGIGVATGADKAFIGPFDDLDVEDERKLPLVTTRDLSAGGVQWRGLGVVNPFEADGTLADLARYPRFAAYLEKNAELLRARHCAQKNSQAWYRTIDRITPTLATTPKLLIPDIKGEAHISLENGQLYPHHNLYFILSNDWPLQALQAVLMAGIAHLFVRAYSTKMHGGALRFQAQYLRRIRLPLWSSLSASDQAQLSAAAAKQDRAAILSMTCQIYGITEDEQQHITPLI